MPALNPLSAKGGSDQAQVPLRQRNIDMVVQSEIEEDDARQRIADLKAQRLEMETEIASLKEAPKIIPSIRRRFRRNGF